MRDDDGRDRLKRAANDPERRSAGFFAWWDHDVADLGVVQIFCEHATNEPGLPFREVRSRGNGNDPPDCEARDCNGGRVGIEVTELVSGDAIEARKAAIKRGDALQGAWAVWNRADFLAELQNRLNEKDEKTLKGDPYDEYLVLIYSDEPNIPIDNARAWLDGHRLTRPVQISRAYLLLSYDPQTQDYPSIRLQW